MKSSGILVGLLVSLLPIPTLASRVDEVTLTFQDGDGGAYSSTAAASVGTLGGGSNGAGTLLYVQSVADLPVSVSYIAFPNIIGTNPGQIPPNSAIEYATLRFTRDSASTDEATLLQVTSAWDEDTVTGATRPTTSDNIATIPAGSGNQIVGILSVVTAWAHGTSNYGLAIFPGTLSADEAFYSDDAPLVSQRPLLKVIFIPPLAPVEPSTWGKVKALYR